MPDRSEQLSACAASVRKVIVQILKYEFVRNGAGCGREVPLVPKSVAPVPDFWKFVLYLGKHPLNTAEMTALSSVSRLNLGGGGATVSLLLQALNL